MDIGNIINHHTGKYGMLINQTIHVVLGGFAVKYPYIIPAYIIYQLYDSIDFANLKRYPKHNDNIMLDLVMFCIGYWVVKHLCAKL